MRTLKKIGVLILLFAPMILLAQDGEESAPQMPYFKFIGAFVLSTLAALVTNALKYVGNSAWNTTEFFRTIILPWLLSVLGGSALVAIEYFAPFIKDYLFLIDVSGDIELNYTALYTLGFTLAISIKKLIDKFKKKA